MTEGAAENVPAPIAHELSTQESNSVPRRPHSVLAAGDSSDKNLFNEDISAVTPFSLELDDVLAAGGLSGKNLVNEDITADTPLPLEPDSVLEAGQDLINENIAAAGGSSGKDLVNEDITADAPLPTPLPLEPDIVLASGSLLAVVGSSDKDLVVKDISTDGPLVHEPDDSKVLAKADIQMNLSVEHLTSANSIADRLLVHKATGVPTLDDLAAAKIAPAQIYDLPQEDQVDDAEASRVKPVHFDDEHFSNIAFQMQPINIHPSLTAGSSTMASLIWNQPSTPMRNPFRSPNSFRSTNPFLSPSRSVLESSPNSSRSTNPFLSPSRSVLESTSNVDPRMAYHTDQSPMSITSSWSSEQPAGTSSATGFRDQSTGDRAEFATVQEDIQMNNVDDEEHNISANQLPPTPSTVLTITALHSHPPPEDPGSFPPTLSDSRVQSRPDERREKRKSKIARAGENLANGSELLTVGSPLGAMPTCDVDLDTNTAPDGVGDIIDGTQVRPAGFDTDPTSGPDINDVDMSTTHDVDGHVLDQPPRPHIAWNDKKLVSPSQCLA